MPAISIVIPVYNTPEEYFRACMASVLAQRFADYEVILVDDGSTTVIGAVCSEYAAKDARFRVLRQANRGVSAARNAGVRAAAGEWVIFLDPDDEWEADTLAPLYETAEREALDVLRFAYCESYGTVRNEVRCFPQQAAGRYELASPELAANMQLGVLNPRVRRMPACFGSACLQLVRRALLQKNALCFDETLCLSEDAVYVLQVWQAAERIGILDLPLYRYRCYAGSATSRYRPDAAGDCDATNQKILTFLEQNGKDAAFFDAYRIWLWGTYFMALRMDINHPDNPKPLAQRKADWRAIPEKYESFRRLCAVRWGSAYPQKQIFAFVAFRLKCWPLAQQLIRLDQKRHS